MNLLIRKLLVLLLAVCAIASCKHDPYEAKQIPLAMPLNDCDPDSIYFQKDVLPIIMANCVSGCHDEVNASDGVVLTSYNRIISTADVKSGNASNSKLYEVLIESDVDDRMPPSPNAALSAENIEIIRKWIEQGALNNACKVETIPIDTLPTDTIPTDTTTNDTTTAGCNPINVSFANDVTPIFSSYGCAGCHSIASSGGGVTLETYTGTKIVADNGRLMGAINHATGFSAMPQGAAKMDSCDIATIQIWINEGTLDN